MQVTLYTLGEYKIIETDNDALWWEAHAGLSAVKRGKCFLRGDILLIGPSESEEPGFLKREFLIKVQQLPKWEKTRYYCSNYTIRACRSGRKLTPEEISEWTGNRTHQVKYADFPQRPFGEPTFAEGQVPAAEVSYKLGRYEITKKTKGQMWWKTYSARGRLREGRCMIAGDILFMEVGETEEPGNLKQTFLERLDQLPEWRTTRFYCPSCAIYDCRTGKNQTGEKRGGLPGKTPPTPTRGVFTPPATTTLSYQPFPKLRRTPFIDSSLSFLKKMTAKAGKSGEREPPGTGLKNKIRKKTETIKSAIKTSKAPFHVYRIKRWIAYIGALILIIGALLLALLNGHWKNGDGHHKSRNHSAGHHRDH